jgi:hypothetical protein
MHQYLQGTELREAGEAEELGEEGELKAAKTC